MSYRGITFNKQMCKSEDDAVIFHTFLNGCAGKVLGCGVTYDQTNVYMAQGYFMAYGRLINVLGAETLTPPAIQTGIQYNRLVFTIDLSKDNTASEFRQGYFEFLTSYDTTPDVTREDLFAGGKLYQMPIASFALTVNGITNFKDEMGSVNIQEVWDTANADLSQYRDQFDTFFGEQKQIILDMIADLEAQDYVTNTEFDAYKDTMTGQMDEKQDISSAITTGNIAQQSVKYATSAGSATSATTATKLGSSTVGGTAKPVYLNAGTATACSATVGGTTKPIYLNAGTATACSATVGNANTPVYLSNGTITSTGKSFANYLPLSGGTMTGRPTMPAIELSSEIPFIDFHYNSSSADYTGRIQQYNANEVTITPNLATNDIRSDGSVNIAGTCSAGMFKNGATIVLAAPNGTNVVNSNNSGFTPINASAFTINSSRLAKENIVKMTEAEARKLLNINVVDFDYKEEFGGTKGQHGVIAEEIIDIIPSCVTVPEGYSEEDFDLEKGIQNKTLSVDYSKLVPYLIKMVQLQQEQINELRGGIENG